MDRREKHTVLHVVRNKGLALLICCIFRRGATAEHPSGGSTDVGDVSWVVPEIRLRATTAAEDTPWHSWAVVACGGMSIGHKGMIFAAKALAMTMVDVFEDEQLRKDIREEWVERVGDYQYAPIVPEGPPPVPDHVTGAGAGEN